MVAQHDEDDALAAQFAASTANAYARARGELVPFPGADIAEDEEHLELVQDDPSTPSRTLTLHGVTHAVPPARAGAMELLGWYNARIGESVTARDAAKNEQELVERAKRVRLYEEGWVRLFVPDMPVGTMLAVTEVERARITHFVNNCIRHDQQEVADALPKAPAPPSAGGAGA